MGYLVKRFLKKILKIIADFYFPTFFTSIDWGVMKTSNKNLISQQIFHFV